MLFIAQRYLFSKKSRSVINIIAGVSLISVATPVAAIIILLSIFNGFGSMVESLNGAVDGELTISAARGQHFAIEDVDTARLRRVEGIEALTMVSEQRVLLRYGERESVATLRGVDENYPEVVPIGEHVQYGEFRTHLGELNRVVMGGAMAQKLGVRRLHDATITLYSLRESRLSALVPTMRFEQESAKLAGVYSLDAQSEGEYIYAPRRVANALLGGGDRVSHIVLSLRAGYKREAVQRELRDVVGQNFNVLRREELNAVLYDIIKYEKWGIIFISIMVMILASLSLIGVVAMLITEKRHDMVTLRTMGASRENLRKIFFLQGMMISKIGVWSGLAIGVVVTLCQQHFGMVKLPAGGFMIDAYPVELQVGDVVGVLFVSLSIAAILNYIVTYRMIK